MGTNPNHRRRGEMISPHTGMPIPATAPAGCIIYEGPSVLSPGDDIIVCLTGLGGRASKNPKTGAMVQAWIMLRDVHPGEARQSGADRAICGLCPLASGRGCYVAGYALSSIWRAYLRGAYPAVSPYDAAAWIAGRSLRVGAYGDPCAVPSAIWGPLVDAASRVTGYTHQWATSRTAAHSDYPYLMASTESPSGTASAVAMGWRTFRIRRPGASILPGEVDCPASDESGHRTTCERCGLCDGRRRAKSVSITTHGSGVNRSLAVVQ